METEYRNRGILHKIANVTKLHKSSNTLVRRTTKTLLYGETALLFAKDVVTNRLVGKEFHVKFERKLYSRLKTFSKKSISYFPIEND